MKKIFICYRRADTEYAAGGLGRELRACFGDEQVFRDKEDVGAGVSWKQQVVHEIDRESALLVLVGREWTEARDSAGRRRLDGAEDPIRIEIEEGLREGAMIIPVLLENAQMPAADQLPAPLKALTDLNARPLRDGDWRYDVDRICQSLEKAGFARAAPAAAPSAVAASGPVAAGAGGPRTPLVTLVKRGVVGAVALAAIAFGAHKVLSTAAPPAPPQAVATNAALRAAVALKLGSGEQSKPKPQPPEESSKLDITGKWTGRATSGGEAFTIDLWVWPSCAPMKKCGTIAISNHPCYGRTSLRGVRDGEYELGVDAFDAGSDLGACKTGAGEYFRLNPDRTLSYRSDWRAKGTLHRVKHAEAMNGP